MTLGGTRQMGRFIVVMLWGVAVLNGNAVPQDQPSITLNPPAAGASQLFGQANNVDTSKIKVVVYALTNQWYVQPLSDAPYTNISPGGSWSTFTHPWSVLVVLLVDPATYLPPATNITNPALDPGVLASAQYPSGPASIIFSGYTWGIKLTGNQPGDQFEPGNNYWSNDPSVVGVQADGLHLSNVQVNGQWQSSEVFLTRSLGYGTYTVQINSPLDHLDQNTVAAPMFIYVNNLNQELDNEYSGFGGLINKPYTAQFVAQPFTTFGNIFRYLQPSTSQFTSQMEWRTDHVTFRTWNGWSATPAAGDIIQEWIYTGANIPVAGPEKVHINLWLNGSPPISGVGDTMIIKSFTFQPPVHAPINADPPSVTFNATYGGVGQVGQVNVTSPSGAVDFTETSTSRWLVTQVTTSVTPSQINLLANSGLLAPGTYNDTITLTSGSNITSVPVDLVITETGSHCDVNQDGTIDVVDVQKLVNETLGTVAAANDLNLDGGVNVADVQTAINAVLNLGCSAR